MKTLLVIASFVFFNHAQACSCVANTGPMDASDSIAKAALVKAGLGRSAKVDKEAMEEIRSYPTLQERMNIGGFKGTSCEITGPRGESHHYCSGTFKADYKVEVTNGMKKCDVVVRTKATPTSVSSRALSMNCVAI